MTRVLLARHGETTWNRTGRVQGWAPTTLTDRGREQARKLGSWLAKRYDIDRTLASDLRRTRETSDGIRSSGATLPEPTFERAWRERGFGVYQGFLAEELLERYPDYDTENSVSALDVTPEGGESIETFCARVESAWTDLSERTGPEETILLVTHGGVIKTLLATVTERSRMELLATHSPPNCSVTTVELSESAGELIAEPTTEWRFE